MVAHRKGPVTEQLISEYENGSTTVELSKKYGMSPAAINGRLTRAGTAIRPARRRALYDDPELSARIVSAYSNGIPMSEVATEIGVTHTTVQRTLSASGAKIRPHGLRKKTVIVPQDPAKLGYLAGLLDGEGNIQFKTKHAGRSVGCKMSIYSTTPGIMRWLLREVGGKVRFDTKRTEKKGWLPIGAWNVYRARDVAVLLYALLPMLIVKKEVAKSALRLFGDHFDIHDSPPTMIASK